MTNELEKQEERLYKHFGVDLSLIPLQRQVRQDIHNILIKLGACSVLSPDCVAINTKNGIHKITNYCFDTTLNHRGCYEHSISLEIKTNYKIEELKEKIKHQVRTLFEEG
jgi:hypothetical protein